MFGFFKMNTVLFDIFDAFYQTKRMLTHWIYHLYKKMYTILGYRRRILFTETVLITGAASGIGKMLAKKLAEEHFCRVILWDIDSEKLEESIHDIQSTLVYGYCVDISDRKQVYHTAKLVEREIGNVTILINNAAIVPSETFFAPFSNDENCLKTIHVNLLGTMWTCKAFLPKMIENQRGHLVTIASAAGMIGANGLSEYCASKFGCIGFHESIQAELHVAGLSEKVKTTLVNPYYIDTGMFHGVRVKNDLFLPILKQETVVEKIVEGILCNQKVICIPNLIYFVPLFKLLPPSLYLPVMNFFGVNQSMKFFEKIRKY